MNSVVDNEYCVQNQQRIIVRLLRVVFETMGLLRILDKDRFNTIDYKFKQRQLHRPVTNVFITWFINCWLIGA